MIPLRLKAELPPISEPLVVRLRDRRGDDFQPDCEAALLGSSDGWHDYDFRGFSMRIEAAPHEPLDGDVLLALPGRSSVNRLIRANSAHNTFVVTERCDQLCVMCSQPPKPGHTDLFALFVQAASLAPPGATIGISGGEPLLYKEQVFNLIGATLAMRPDLRFHVLTNAQHFEPGDETWLCEVASDKVLWGIPLYAPVASDHDGIVAKAGAFDNLLQSMAILARAGALVELRTVVTAQNVANLPRLADLVTTDLPFCSRWALMQLEPIGFGRMNWDTLFHDSSVGFEPIARAMNIALARNLDVALFNFPLCTVPDAYRRYAPATISDWKQKFIQCCDECSLRTHCSGFFEWYDQGRGFTRLGPI